MDGNALAALSAWTGVVLLVVFLAIVAWAWNGARESRFAAAARAPLDDDDSAGAAARSAGAQE